LVKLVRMKRCNFQTSKLVSSLYRPFTKQWLYFDGMMNHRVGQMPHIFPDATAENLVICVSGVGARSGFSVLMSETLPDLEVIEKSQCFPLYLYSEPENEIAEAATQQIGLFATSPPAKPERKRRDAITDAGRGHFQEAYPGETISKEDVFYYVYGLLHSPEYRERYADNLSKELPRIPCVKTAADFWAFSAAGRKLAELHLHYETMQPYPVKIDSGGKRLTDADYRVEKMRYGKKGKDKDLTTLHYNGKITLTGIPLEAYDYIVNGKPALDWVVERQCVKTDKDSGIVNDANDWAVETMKNPRYPLELFQRVITVSLETMKIVRNLPGLEI
jgi:predicted helicase